MQVKEDKKKYFHEYYERNKEHIKERAAQYQREHRSECNEKVKRWFRNNPEKRKVSQHDYYLRNRDLIYERQGKYRRDNAEHVRELAQKHAHKRNLLLKIKVLAHYGNGMCACLKCGFGDVRALSIDHINGDGYLDREKRNGVYGANFYRQLIREGFPQGYQTLCMNCQFIKRQENGEYRGALCR